ncbi:MAG: methylmalonyl-CoA carboxyltransferase [Acidimicrobiales bacterium]|nr:methylmalonyl-CoA carboxyltransferase [Acidimicrobiales bacterium]
MSDLDLRASVPGCTSARITDFGGRPCVHAVVDPAADDGALGPEDGLTLAAAADGARERRIPLVCCLASSGAAPEAGIAALDGWGRAARSIVRCSGTIPIVFCVHGPTVAGPALLLGLADHVVMVDDTYAYVSGPRMVERFTGVSIDGAALGGTGVHARTSGVAGFTAADVDAAHVVVTDLLTVLPSHADELAPRQATDDTPDRPTPELAEVIPDTPTGSYDVRTVLRALVDDDWLLESRARWAENLVTAFATIDGWPVGLVANQPCALAGTLDIPASQKGARFVSFCDAFNLPLITVVDTPGFYPGKDLEWRGMIRHGAQMAFAYARATVPRWNVTQRQSYDGGYIVMDSKFLGNDLALAWPSAEIAVMGAKGAVEILHRRSDADERARREAEYEDRLLNPYVAAERGSVDAVIDPTQTRQVLAAALAMLATKREPLRSKTHDNTPL